MCATIRASEWGLGQRRTSINRRIRAMCIEDSVKVIEVVALELDAPVVVDKETPVKEVLQQMREGQSGCALACDGGRLCGIFTERDVLNKVIGVEGVLQRRISELMTPDPVSVHENDSIRKAVLAMHHGGFRNVPVVDCEERVVSCVRHKDIVHYLVEHFAQKVLNLPPDPENMPTTPDGG
jgi:CBS domain-containing protein